VARAAWIGSWSWIRRLQTWIPTTSLRVCWFSSSISRLNRSLSLPISPPNSSLTIIWFFVPIMESRNKRSPQLTRGLPLIDFSVSEFFYIIRCFSQMSVVTACASDFIWRVAVVRNEKKVFNFFNSCFGFIGEIKKFVSEIVGGTCFSTRRETVGFFWIIYFILKLN